MLGWLEDGNVIDLEKVVLLSSECVFFFSSRRRHTRLQGDWSSDVCSSDLRQGQAARLSTSAPQRGQSGSWRRRMPARQRSQSQLPRARQPPHRGGRTRSRSEERRVGKEGRSRWSPYH